MPVPWWQRIIDPEALVALIVLVALFTVAYMVRRYLRFRAEHNRLVSEMLSYCRHHDDQVDASLARGGNRRVALAFHRWRGFRLDRCDPPWTTHLVMGFVTLDVMR